MKERPILFSGAMVRALLDGSKTQTRRIVKLPHNNRLGQWEPTVIGGENGGRTAQGEMLPLQGAIWHTRTGDSLMCPHGSPGDRLYVRETWAQPTTLDPGPTFYRADYPACVPDGFENVPPASEITWKPSIHMPRVLSRLTLEVADIRVERVQDINETGAVAEGVEPVTYGPIWPAFEEMHYWRGYMNHERAYRDTAIDSFNSLWRSVNGPESWDTNPWVWVVEFKRIDA